MPGRKAAASCAKQQECENKDGDCTCERGLELPRVVGTDSAAARPAAEQQHVQCLLAASHSSHGRG